MLNFVLKISLYTTATITTTTTTTTIILIPYKPTEELLNSAIKQDERLIPDPRC